MTLSLPLARRATKCLVPGASAIYLFNEGAGTVLTDYSGNGNHGTLGAGAAAPTWGPTGLTFTGANGTRVVLPGLPAISTIAMVFYAPSDITAATAAGYLFSTTDAASSSPGIALGTLTGVLTNEVITILSDASTSRSAWCSEAGAIAAGWHTLVCTLNGAQWVIVLDGTALPITYVGTPGAIPASTSATFGIKSNFAGGALTGGLGVVALYPFSVSTAQAAQITGAFAAVMNARGVTLP